MVRKRELSIGIVILLVATSAYLLGWTNLFTVKQIEIEGAPNQEIKTAVMQYSELTIGQKLARVEPRTVANKLNNSGIDWLENVDISRNWISGKLVIALKARKAIATVGDKYSDQSGALFKSPVAVKNKLPELVAADRQSRENGLDLYLKLPASFRDQVTGIFVTSQESYQFQLGERLKVVWGGKSDSEVKVKIFQKLLALPENKEIKLMDLSDPTKPTVR